MKKKFLLLAVLLTVLLMEYTQAQECALNDSLWQEAEIESTAEAKNGWFLPSSGMLRVLVVYIEIDYDLTPGNDPYPNGSADWTKGQLPNYKDNLFDAEWSGNLQGSVTRYYNHASHGNLKILGDYVDSLFIVKESDAIPGTFNTTIIHNAISQINQWGVLNTKNNMSIADFDNWQDNNMPGSVKISGSDNPHSFDHVFFIVQNNHTWMNKGDTYFTSYPNILGYPQDTRSETSMAKDPTLMFVHEFGHLLFGANNFHNGGGHVGSGTGKTFIPNQGGWSIMGGSETSILTFNAWERDRMEWQHPSKTYLNSALDENLNEVETALDATNSNHAGIYILRDFVTTGDVIRIKLPFIPTNEFQQYLWIENHQTAQNNGFEFDRFKHQNHTCMDEMQPGLYMYMQAGKDIKVGSAAYSQSGHYTRPIPANGMYDLQFESTTHPVTCVASGAVEPYEKLPQFANPLTGNQEQELYAADLNADNLIGNEVKLTWLERVNGVVNPNLANNGTIHHVFTKNGVAKLGVGTNPSANSMITLSNNNGLAHNNGLPPDNRKVILNGISIEILDELQDGSIKVEVKLDDTDIANDVRWCGDIELPAIAGANGYSLNLTQGNTMLLDQGFTATKINTPMSIGGTNYFVDPTVLTCDTNSYFHLEENADLYLTRNSTLILKSGSKLELEDGAELFIHQGELIIEDGAELILHDGAKLTVDTDGKLTINNTTTGKGLIVGDNTVTSNQAEILINGTLTFASNAIWEHKKSGFYNFASTHTLNLPSTVDVTFTGLLISHKMLELQNSCQLTFSGNTINWSKGLIHYGLSAQVNLTNADYSGTVLTFTGPTISQPGSIGLNVDNPTKMHLFNSSIEKLQTGVKISNATATGMLLGNTYTDNVISIDLDSTASTTIAQSSFSTSYSGAIGIKAVASFLVTISATTIIGLDKGAYFYNVDAAYINNSSNISYSIIGIEAENTLLFVRGQSEIHQNTKGVAIFGSYNYSTNNYSSMLTVGDVGCGAIYDNTIGVYGRDAILNIDAIEHSINSSGSDTIPNRFDNNSTYAFDICYTDYTVAPSQINAKMNYWGGTVIPTSNYRLKTNTDCIAKPNHGTNIPLITSPHSTCIPTPNCANCTMTGGGGGGTSSSSPIGGLGLMVINAFQTANEPFVEEDNLTTREGFTDISSVGLLKDTTNQTWQAVTINNNLLSIDKNSVHRIQVAKAIKAKATNSNMRLTNAPKNIFAGITENTNELSTNVQVYPNPVNSELMISIEDVKGIYMLNIYQISGKLIIEEKLNNSLSNIDVSSLENGIYFYEIISENGERLTGKVSVVR